MYYLFQLGRQPEISTAEIQAVFSLLQISFDKVYSDDKYLIVDVEKELDNEKLMKRLGGTIKIGKQLGVPTKVGKKHVNQVFSNKDGSASGGRLEANISAITNYLNTTQPSGKIQFSLSGDNADKIALSAKKELKNLGRSVRYIKANNTATILHNNLVEKQTDLTIINRSADESPQIFVTQAIQPIEELGARDFDRPGRDAKSGMLPPKLAKIMINLAQAKQDAVILDPFCGSGTILMEASLMGYKNLIGSDISDKAIKDTKTNLAWLKIPVTRYRLLVTSSQSIDQTLKPSSVDAIVTEPFLGNPLKGTETKEQLVKQAQELKTLYVNAFKSFEKILKKDGTIIFIIPCFRFKDEWIRIDFVEEISAKGRTSLWLEKLGFKPSGDPLLYWRQGQKVGREIWGFTK